MSAVSPAAGRSLFLDASSLSAMGSRSQVNMSRISLDNDRAIEEIDRIIMQSHSLRGKVASSTAQSLKDYAEDDKVTTRALLELPDSMEKWEKLQMEHREQRRMQEEIEASLNQLVSKMPPLRGSDHSLNFHLAKHNPLLAAGTGAGEGDEDIGDEQDDMRTVSTFYAPQQSSSASQQQSDARFQPPKSRKAKKLFNSAPPSLPVNVEVHRQKELMRRHRCRKALFGMLEEARREEEQIMQQLEDCERSVRCAPDDETRRCFEKEKMHLHQELKARRRQAAEQLDDMYAVYQPKVPSSREDDTLRDLERQLRLPILAEVYREVKAELASLAEQDALREQELASIAPGQSPMSAAHGVRQVERMNFEGNEDDYQYEEYEYDEDQQYDDDAEFDDDDDGGGGGGAYENDGDFEDEGNNATTPPVLQSHVQQCRPQSQEKVKRRGEGEVHSVVVGLPQSSQAERSAADKLALDGLVDPEAQTAIHHLGVQRPTTLQGQAIDRGVAGRVQDNILYNIETREKTQHKVAGHKATSDDKTSEPRYSSPQINATQQETLPAAAEGDAAVKHADARGVVAAASPTTSTATTEKGSRVPPRIAELSDQGSSSSVLSDDTPPHKRRVPLLTRGTKLGDRNVLVRMYREQVIDDDVSEHASKSEKPLDHAVIILTAFDPLAQCTYEGVVTEHDFIRVFGRNLENMSDVEVAQAGERIVAHLKLQGGTGACARGSQITLHLDVQEAVRDAT